MRPDAIRILEAIYAARYDGLRVVTVGDADSPPKRNRFDPVPVALIHAMLNSLPKDTIDSHLDYLKDLDFIHRTQSQSSDSIGCFLTPDCKKVELKRTPQYNTSGRHVGNFYVAILEGKEYDKKPCGCRFAFSGGTVTQERRQHYECIRITQSGLEKLDKQIEVARDTGQHQGRKAQPAKSNANKPTKKQTRTDRKFTDSENELFVELCNGTMSQRDIADKLNTSESAISNRKKRLEAKLRTMGKYCDWFTGPRPRGSRSIDISKTQPLNHNTIGRGTDTK